MIDEALRGVIDAARTPVPLPLVAMWAAVAVVAAVIVVRLRDGDFGWGPGAALFAIGVASIALLCAVGRYEALAPGHRDQTVVERQLLRACRAHLQARRAGPMIPSAHGQVSVPRFQDAVPR